MKNFLIAGLVMLAATAAQASYLYWQVNAIDLDSAIAEYNTKFKPATMLSQDDISGAHLVQVDGNGKLTTLGSVAKSDFGEKQQSAALPIDVTTVGNNYSYYIEIISNAPGLPYEQVAKSTMMTYNDLVTANPNVIYTSELSVPSLAAWTGGTYTAAPEPTSGLLVLIGVGLLGLKRKRA